MTVGFLYGAGAETLIFATGTSGKKSENFRVPAEKPKSAVDTQKTKKKTGVWVSGAEIQTSAVDTRTAVWVSTAENFSKIVLGETRNFSQKFRGVSAPAVYKNPAVKRERERAPHNMPRYRECCKKRQAATDSEWGNTCSGPEETPTKTKTETLKSTLTKTRIAL